MSCADYRAAWDAIETQWNTTLDRARRLPEAKLHEQVDGEWSFVQTQRHLLMASDAWIGSAVLEEDAPYHPLGLPYSEMPPEAQAKLGLDLDATPSLRSQAKAGVMQARPPYVRWTHVGWPCLHFPMRAGI